MTRHLNRRQALGALGSVSLGALLAACGSEEKATTSAATPTATVSPQTESSAALGTQFDQAAACSVTVEQTEGPYYFDADAIRSDIREDREGVPLRLGIRVRDTQCEPVANAVVDIWHCDAGGVYSGFDAGEGERFLRGTQVTNRGGIVEFQTIYPGFYPGRTVHIHAKVHLDKQEVLTTQLYFDDEVSGKLFAGEPYASSGERDQTNESDGIFDPSLLLTLKPDEEGYLGLMNFDLA